MKYRSLILLLAAIAGGILAPAVCRASDPSAPPARFKPPYASTPRDLQAAWALHVLEGRRYFDCTLASGRLAEAAPGDAGADEIRGTIALHVGDIGQAARCFRSARERAAPGDALAAYGLGLCALFRKDDAQAATALTDALARADSANKPRVLLAQAALAAEQGRIEDAIQIANGLDTPAAQELAALATYRASPKNGLPLIERFLAQSQTDGVPIVAEPPGLRLLGGFAGDGPALEPSVEDATLRAMLARRLDSDPLGGNSASGVKALTGVVTLRPPAALFIPSRSAMVSVSVDGRLIGMVNTAPYDFTWDTSAVANGPHTLSWSADSSGRMASASQPVLVRNEGTRAAAVSAPLPKPLRDQLWKLLTIQPSYKLAQYTLGKALARAGETEEANDHFLIASAIDPAYKDAGARVAAALAGRAPGPFALPHGVRLARTGGIAGENHSDGFWMGSPDRKEIALTFDDGPNAGTQGLLEALRAAGAHATFFVVGIPSSEHPEIVRAMAAAGDDIEDHSYSHPNLSQALPSHIREEVLRDAVVIRALSGRWPMFFRPPGGDADPQVLRAAHACGMAGAFWTVDALSAENTGSPASVAKWVVGHARPGSIVLMHDGIPCTTAAIPAMVRELRARGYKLVTLRQLARDAVK